MTNPSVAPRRASPVSRVIAATRLEFDRLVGSLWVRLVGLVFVAALASSTVLGASLIQHDRAALRDQVFQSHLAAARLAAQLTAVEVGDAQDQAREFAGRPGVIDAVLAGANEPLGTELERFMNVHAAFDSVGIYDLDGFRLVSGFPNPLNAGASSADRDWFQVATTTGSPYLGLPTRSRATGRPTVPYGVPILDGGGGVRAVLVAGISLATLSEEITSIAAGPGVRPNLVDLRSGGVILAHIDPARILTAVSGQNVATQELLAGNSGTVETTSSSGESVLAAYTPVPGLPWGILLLQPAAEAFAPLDAATRRAVGLGGLIVILAALFAGLLAYTITRPLLRLRQAASALTAGDLSQRVNFAGHDEISQLGRDFDRMAQALSQRTQRNLVLQEELRHQALRDPLTGLYNRRYLDTTLERELQRASRNGLPLAVAMLDLDHFKQVNDTLGHAAGDALLRECGALLRKRSRREDIPARYGGEELVLVLPGANLEQMRQRAEELRTGLQALPIQERLAPVGGVTVSIGIAAYPECGTDAASLLRAADVAMYRAKAEGRNRVVAASLMLNTTESAL